MRTGANLKCKSPALLTTRGLHQNSLYDLKDSPSCLADCFTWPQVALTHHVVATGIETPGISYVKTWLRSPTDSFATVLGR